MKKNLLILGYGIDTNRNEAVSGNVLRLKSLLLNKGFKVDIVNIGYKTTEGAHLGNNMFDALLSRKKIVGKIITLINNKQYTYVHDFFVLPLASVLFTLPLKRHFPKIKFIKIIQNIPGYSNAFDSETIIRFFANRKRHLNTLINNFDVVYSNSIWISKHLKIDYVPLDINVRKTIPKNKLRRICYLGHPLGKKGVNILPELISSLPVDLANKFDFDFAFSNLGRRDIISRQIKKEAIKKGIRVTFSGVVDVSKYFRNQDIFLAPLRDAYAATSFPKSLLEAMEGGCIVLTTKNPIINSVIKDGHNGYLLDNLNLESFIKKLHYIIKHKKEAFNLIQNARRYIIVNHSERVIMPKLLRLYG